MEQVRKVFVVIYLITMICYFFSETSGNFKKRAVNKILLASLFLVFSFYSFIAHDKGKQIVNYILLVAIFFSFLGDVLLLFSFDKGGMAFIIGNICYSIYLLLIFYDRRLLLWPFLLLFSLFYGIYILMLKKGYLDLKGKKAFSYYMASIVAHGSLGLLLSLNRYDPLHCVLGNGLTMFMISDFFLASHYFHDKSKNLILILNSGFYFTGMMLVALYMSFI